MIRRELNFFILNGIVSVALAYFVYRVLVFEIIFDVNWANGVAYISGMLYGFFSNRKWAFQDRGFVTNKKITRYILLYMLTLIVNVTINATILNNLKGVYGAVIFSFLIAIGFSTTLNFIGLKYFVYNLNNNIIAEI